MNATVLPRAWVRRISVPPSHFAVAASLALAWGLANVLGWALGHGTDDPLRTAAHFVYQALLPLLLLAVGLGIADARANGNDDAVAPYVVAAVAAPLLGEVLFAITSPLLGLARCGCNMDDWPPGARSANMLPDSLLICSFVTAGYRYRKRWSQRLARVNARELEGAQLVRRTQESRLQAMQACIEPEFLFDTLEAVQRIHMDDPVRGARLVDELIIYLRAALPHLRESTSTVAKEAELAHAWININRFRNGRGPQFDMDLGAAAGAAKMPPMVLLPLVDFAFARVADGGALRIEARASPEQLRFVVETTGGTRDAAPSAAQKLAALRSRLDTLYGHTARLSQGSRGEATTVSLEIPREHADGAHR